MVADLIDTVSNEILGTLSPRWESLRTHWQSIRNVPTLETIRHVILGDYDGDVSAFFGAVIQCIAFTDPGAKRGIFRVVLQLANMVQSAPSIQAVTPVIPQAVLEYFRTAVKERAQVHMQHNDAISHAKDQFAEAVLAISDTLSEDARRYILHARRAGMDSLDAEVMTLRELTDEDIRDAVHRTVDELMIVSTEDSDLGF